MTNKKVKVFSKIEMKMLIFNKMKNKGMDYVHAREELSKELAIVQKNHNAVIKKKPEFKEEFNKLLHG